MPAYDDNTFGDEEDVEDDDDDEEEMVPEAHGTSDYVRRESPDEWQNPQAPTRYRRAPPLP